MRKLAFHTHSSFSYDSLSSPKSIVRYCQRHNIDSVCVTDHDTIRGSVEAEKIAKKHGVQVIIGAEYYSEIGDIIGLFLKEEIASRRSIEIIEQVKAQGGITILPHPFHHHRLNDELVRSIDVVEVFNARCSEDENARAFELAKRLRKPMVAGADAHFLSELSGATMSFAVDRDILPHDLISTSRTWTATYTHPLRTRLSQITKAVKTLDPVLLWRSSRSLVYTMVHDGLFAPHAERKIYHNEWNSDRNE